MLQYHAPAKQLPSYRVSAVLHIGPWKLRWEFWDVLHYLEAFTLKPEVICLIQKIVELV